MSGIRLSKKHGLNPTIPQCFYCGKSKNMLLLVGSATNQFQKAGVSVSSDGEMPSHCGILDREPCDECKQFMEQGIMLISCRDGEEGKENPYRTGSIVVVTEDFISTSLNDISLIDHIFKARMSFVPDEAWNLLKLPRPDDNINVAESNS